MTVLVTGANGFVGTALCRKLMRDGVSIRGAVREVKPSADIMECISIGNITGNTNWTYALQNVELIVHLASLAYLPCEKCSGQLEDIRIVNVDGTFNLARQAAAAGVRRFVYLSSIKVNGEFSKSGRPFKADDIPAPTELYGITKHEAEQLLRRIATETGMEVVIVRPPLVYGFGVKANFELMVRWVARGLPLPLAALNENRRSLLALCNLIDLLAICLYHPAAANQTFLVSDGEDLSTVDLLQRIGRALEHPARLFYAPLILLKHGAVILNKRDTFYRLSASLQLDISKTKTMLNWSPPVSVDDGLMLAVKGFRK